MKSGGADVTYMRNHEATEGFPYTADELKHRYDAVILSDIPADSLLLPRAVFVEGKKRPNRLRSLGRFVEQGGGLLMVGGYVLRRLRGPSALCVNALVSGPAG